MGTIVVGVDGSDASKDALRWAIDEARLRRDVVIALNAWEAPVMPPPLGPEPVMDVGASIPDLEALALRLVEHAVEEVSAESPDVEVRPVATAGPPAAVLVEAARDADLLVVGSR